MPHTHEAIFENGILRPVAPLSGLTEGQRVTITVHALAGEGTEASRRESEFLEDMERGGRLVHFDPPTAAPPRDYVPPRIEGEPLSEQILRERR